MNRDNQGRIPTSQGRTIEDVAILPTRETITGTPAECGICGNPIEDRRLGARYCSSTCYRIASYPVAMSPEKRAYTLREGGITIDDETWQLADLYLYHQAFKHIDKRIPLAIKALSSARDLPDIHKRWRELNEIIEDFKREIGRRIADIEMTQKIIEEKSNE